MINQTQLRRAIKAGDVETVLQFLREHGKAFALKIGWAPLHLAVKAGKKEVVSALLEHGVPVNQETEARQTASDIAAAAGNGSILKTLRSAGGKSAVELSLHGACFAGGLKWVRRHCQNGADINQINRDELPVCIAFERGHWDVAAYLLNKNCDVRKNQKWGVTPLHVAAASGADERLLSKILALRAVVDAKDDCLATPLCWAAGGGHRHVVDWLLDHGANVATGSEGGSTPVSNALEKGFQDLATYLIDRGALSTLHQAVQLNHLGRARQKLNAGANPNKERDDSRGETALEMAIWLDSTEMAELLLEYSADPNYQDVTRRFACTPLHAAVDRGSAKMVKLLLSHGADCDIQNSEGLTPIEYAKRRDRSHLVTIMERHLDRKLSITPGQGPVEQFYTVQKVAELLSVEEAFVMRLLAEKKVTCVKLDDRTIRIPAGSLQRYLSKLMR